MDMWIPVTIAAAGFQTLRFMLQKTLSSTRLSASGATFARFAYSAPIVLAALAVALWATGQNLPAMGARFWGFAALGGLTQILATLFVVMLFKQRNFAVGITFKKTEVIQTVLVGVILLGESVSPLAFGAICI
ncbi:MAG: EamA/RhaT family transporter, partial [Pseudomonadota bacterium]|nr:EamA/RhaT family transporter [Pseudomonadota bacterium]